MTYNTTIYTIFIFCLCALALKRTKLGFVLASLIALISNLSLIQSLSITQWLDTLCGNPSLLLALLSLSSLLTLPKNSLINHFLHNHTAHLSLSKKSKIYLVIFGFVLFWGNINYLWGIDLFNADFYTQIFIASLITLVGYLIQPYLGFLLLFSMMGYFLRGGNIFVYMMDALIWLYALLSLLLALFTSKNRAK